VTGWQIRPFETLDELRACVELQEETWGPGFTEKVPVSLLKVSQRLGGVAAGAWDESGRLLGFVFGMTGIEDGRPVHWSDMLAVRPEFRDVGLGWRLKAYQRRVLLERGVRSCYWTFDPLESRNAYLNFTKLGAVVREYVVDMYGDSDSPLHRGLGTDRFVALWKLDSQRVESRLVGRTPPLSLVQFAGLPRAFGVEGGLEVPIPAPAPPPDAGDPARFLVPIPSRIQDLKLRDPDAARAWREATRAVFTRTVGRGYQVVELIREGLLSYYVVERVKSAPKHAEQGAVRDRTR
jgi:predicted GNAT superfamily acetyltransferase